MVDSVDPLLFRLDTADVPMGPGNRLIFKNGKGHEGFHLFYRLEGAEGFRFPAEGSDACYVAHGSAENCPSSKSSWGQFQPMGVEEDGRVLKIFNKNDSRRDFSYTLRITDGNRWLELDPGGVNHNGDGNDE